MAQGCKKALLQWALVLALVAGAAPAFAQSGGVSGKATDENGKLYVGYPILIERQEVKGVYKTKTDKHGGYVYIGLPIGQYKVTLQDPNGRTIYYVTKHVGFGDPTEIDFDMAKEKAQAQAANPAMQKQLEQQKKEAGQFTGLKQLFDQATGLYDQGKYADAAATYEQALPLAKGNNRLVVMQRIADCYSRAREYDKASATYQKAIAENPQVAALHNDLANVYGDMNKVPEAQQEFEKAVQLDPTIAPRAYFGLGAVMYNKGKTDEAAAAFKKATEADPNFADAYFLLAQSLMGKATMTPDGKVVAAPGTVEALQTYLKLEPSGKHTPEAQAMLQTIQGAVQTEYKSAKKKKKG